MIVYVAATQAHTVVVKLKDPNPKSQENESCLRDALRAIADKMGVTYVDHITNYIRASSKGFWVTLEYTKPNQTQRARVSSILITFERCVVYED